MENTDLKILEQRVEELIRSLQRMREENLSLRESQSVLIKERAQLIEKHEEARVRVEAMISRLKAMEQEA